MEGQEGMEPGGIEPRWVAGGENWVFDTVGDEDAAGVADDDVGNVEAGGNDVAWSNDEDEEWSPDPSTLGFEAGPTQAGTTAVTVPQVLVPTFSSEGAASSVSPAARASATEPVSPNPHAKRQRRNYEGIALSADQVVALMGEELTARPLILDLEATPQANCGGWVFKEVGKVRRSTNSRADKWRRGGGASGATDLPSSREPRVRRRYGYVIPAGDRPVRHRYHQYCLLTPTKLDDEQSEGGPMHVVEDTQTWLFHVLPATTALVPTADLAKKQDQRAPITEVRGTLHVDAQVQHGSGDRVRDPLLRLSAAPRTAGEVTGFVRFEEGSRELGGIFHSDHGLQLRSAAGDFAEWHPARNKAELPYAEGSVVGLFGGKISLKTVDADMVAVVSRRALCVGSFPGPDKAVEGDVIAYLGQVPIRVRGQVASGDRLVPSMRHDGTAVVARDETSSGRPDHAVVIGIAMTGRVPGDDSEKDGRCSHDNAEIGMVDALITPPSAQQRSPKQQILPQTEIDPALDFAAYQDRSINKCQKLAVRRCIAVVVIVTAVVLALMQFGIFQFFEKATRASRCQGKECIGPSASPQAPSVELHPCHDVACGPGTCNVTVNGSTVVGPSLRRHANDGGRADDHEVDVWCACPEGFSSKMTVSGNGNSTLSCMPNACKILRGNLRDPLASHTVQWAMDWSYSYSRVNMGSCGTTRTFERCAYHCDPGYLPTGDALCLPNGTIAGGGCLPVRCAPLAIPHSNHALGNECTGLTGDTCNITCAKGYRRADQVQTTLGVVPQARTGQLLCVPSTQEFMSDFAFAVSGATAAAYNGVYTMTNNTCHGRPVWQQQRSQDGITIDDGPVLYPAVYGTDDDPDTMWMLGPAERAVDCSDVNTGLHAIMPQTTCTGLPSLAPHVPRGPDHVACNPPVSVWREILTSCEGLGDQCSCPGANQGFPDDMCFFTNDKLRVNRTIVDATGPARQRQLCVPAE